MKKGYTLIEIVIVTVIIGIVLPIILNVVFIVFREQAKVVKMQEMRKRGDMAMDFVVNTLKRNVEKVYDGSGNELCSSSSLGNNSAEQNGGTNIMFFQLRDTVQGGATQPYVSFVPDPNGTDLRVGLYSGLGGTGPTLVEDAPFTVSEGGYTYNRLLIRCDRLNDFAPPRLRVAFTVEDAEGARLEYSTYVQLQLSQNL